MMRIIFDTSNFDAHKDISVQIPLLGIDTVVDSYYLLIDNAFMPDDESNTKTSRCLRHMTACWAERCELAAAEDVLYLAYDFSDQYIGVLKVYVESADTIVLSDGYTTAYHGYDVSPYETPLLPLKVEAFESSTHESIIERNEFIRQLKNILEIK